MNIYQNIIMNIYQNIMNIYHNIPMNIYALLWKNPHFSVCQ